MSWINLSLVALAVVLAGNIQGSTGRQVFVPENGPSSQRECGLVNPLTKSRPTPCQMRAMAAAAAEEADKRLHYSDLLEREDPEYRSLQAALPPAYLQELLEKYGQVQMIPKHLLRPMEAYFLKPYDDEPGNIEAEVKEEERAARRKAAQRKRYQAAYPPVYYPPPAYPPVYGGYYPPAGPPPAPYYPGPAYTYPTTAAGNATATSTGATGSTTAVTGTVTGTPTTVAASSTVGGSTAASTVAASTAGASSTVAASTAASSTVASSTAAAPPP